MAPKESITRTAKLAKQKEDRVILAGFEFPRFNRLPQELRDKIWEAAIPEARTITLRGYNKKERQENIEAYGDHLVKHNSKKPSMIYACHDSRAIALKYYEPAFEHILNGELFYFDFGRDRLHFKHTTDFLAFYLPLARYWNSGGRTMVPQHIISMEEKVKFLVVGDYKSSCAQYLFKRWKSLETIYTKSGKFGDQLTVYLQQNVIAEQVNKRKQQSKEDKENGINLPALRINKLGKEEFNLMVLTGGGAPLTRYESKKLKSILGSIAANRPSHPPQSK